MGKPNNSMKRLREILNVTQEEFARMLGVSKQTIVSIECGRNQLTAKMNRKIKVVCGASLMTVGIRYDAPPKSELLPDGKIRCGWSKAPGYPEYSLEAMKFHQENYLQGKGVNDLLAEHADELRELFELAAKGTTGGKRYDLARLSLDFSDWIAEQKAMLKPASAKRSSRPKSAA